MPTQPRVNAPRVQQRRAQPQTMADFGEQSAPIRVQRRRAAPPPLPEIEDEQGTVADFYEEPEAPPAPRARTQARATPRNAQRVAPKRRIEVDEETGEEFEYVRVPARSQPRTEHRDPVREGRRGRVEVRGRGGEVLTRKRSGTVDIFETPPAEAGWEFQWIAHTVHGNSEIVADQNLLMTENGWRPVDASRFPGRFMPAGYKGHIVRGGQGLYERPASLSEEARNEDLRKARQLITDRNESLQLTRVRKEMADGFEMSGKYRGTGGNIKIQMDRNVDMPRPEYTLANDE